MYFPERRVRMNFKWKKKQKTTTTYIAPYMTTRRPLLTYLRSGFYDTIPRRYITGTEWHVRAAVLFTVSWPLRFCSLMSRSSLPSSPRLLLHHSWRHGPVSVPLPGSPPHCSSMKNGREGDAVGWDVLLKSACLLIFRCPAENDPHYWIFWIIFIYIFNIYILNWIIFFALSSFGSGLWQLLTVWRLLYLVSFGVLPSTLYQVLTTTTTKY